MGTCAGSHRHSNRAGTGGHTGCRSSRAHSPHRRHPGGSRRGRPCRSRTYEEREPWGGGSQKRPTPQQPSPPPHIHTPTPPECAAAAVGPSFTALITEGALVPRVAHAEPTAGVTAAVPEVTVASAVTAGPPPARLALTHPTPLVTRRQVAAARMGALQAPVAPLALTSAGQLVAAHPHRPPADTLARFGAGGVPPALVAGAVPVDGVAAAVPGALAGVLAEGTPAVGIARALARGRVAPAMWVAPARLAAVWSPELRRTAWRLPKGTEAADPRGNENTAAGLLNHTDLQTFLSSQTDI